MPARILDAFIASLNREPKVDPLPQWSQAPRRFWRRRRWLLYLQLNVPVAELFRLDCPGRVGHQARAFRGFRSADWQSAVSQAGSLHRAALPTTPADYQSATQQTDCLRYVAFGTGAGVGCFTCNSICRSRSCFGSVVAAGILACRRTGLPSPAEKASRTPNRVTRNPIRPLKSFVRKWIQPAGATCGLAEQSIRNWSEWFGGAVERLETDGACRSMGRQSQAREACGQTRAV
jgi:hypothetical protein